MWCLCWKTVLLLVCAGATTVEGGECGPSEQPTWLLCKLMCESKCKVDYRRPPLSCPKVCQSLPQRQPLDCVCVEGYHRRDADNTCVKQSECNSQIETNRVLLSAKPLADEPQTTPMPVASPDCLMPKDDGHTTNCATSHSSIAWYFDPLEGLCLAFKSSGCGNGNKNRFASMGECQEHCLLQDWSQACGINAAPLKGESGKPVTCSYKIPGKSKCPPGFKCRMGAFHGFCCPQATEELAHRNQHPQCVKGVVVTTKYSTDLPTDVPLLGKSCADAFCPAGAVCVQQELYAHCCMDKDSQLNNIINNKNNK